MAIPSKDWFAQLRSCRREIAAIPLRPMRGPAQGCAAGGGTDWLKSLLPQHATSPSAPSAQV